MTITVKYLASLAEELEKTSETLDTDGSLNILDVWQQLNPSIPLKPNTICAINFEYAHIEALVPDGAEVAFFPPVTGG